MMTDNEYLDTFETGLEEQLLGVCAAYGMSTGRLLQSDDIDALWQEKLAPDYMADAVKQINDYPEVTMAWAAYLGMAVAEGWDSDWERCRDRAYKDYYGPRGFDDMDEHILKDILHIPLDSELARHIIGMLQSFAETAISIIRHADLEPGSTRAYYAVARALKVMFRIGVSVELKKLGYKMERVC